MQIEIKKKARVVILISDKTDFKIKTVTRDKGHYVMIKISTQRTRRVASPGGTEVPRPFPAHCPRHLFQLAIPVLHLLAGKKVHNSRAVSSVLFGASEDYSHGDSFSCSFEELLGRNREGGQ